MNTIEATFDQVLNLARHLPLPDRVRLVSQLTGCDDANSTQQDSLNAAIELDERPPSERNISDFISPEDAEMAALTAPLEEAWKKSGMTRKELLKALDESRKRVFEHEFGDLL